MNTNVSHMLASYLPLMSTFLACLDLQRLFKLVTVPFSVLKIQSCVLAIVCMCVCEIKSAHKRKFCCVRLNRPTPTFVAPQQSPPTLQSPLHHRPLSSILSR